jgi:hypothetical protein
VAVNDEVPIRMSAIVLRFYTDSRDGQFEAKCANPQNWTSCQQLLPVCPSSTRNPREAARNNFPEADFWPGTTSDLPMIRAGALGRFTQRCFKIGSRAAMIRA